MHSLASEYPEIVTPIIELADKSDRTSMRSEESIFETTEFSFDEDLFDTAVYRKNLKALSEAIKKRELVNLGPSHQSEAQISDIRSNIGVKSPLSFEGLGASRDNSEIHMSQESPQERYDNENDKKSKSDQGQDEIISRQLTDILSEQLPHSVSAVQEHTTISREAAMAYIRDAEKRNTKILENLVHIAADLRQRWDDFNILVAERKQSSPDLGRRTQRDFLNVQPRDANRLSQLEHDLSIREQEYGDNIATALEELCSLALPKLKSRQRQQPEKRAGDLCESESHYQPLSLNDIRGIAKQSGEYDMFRTINPLASTYEPPNALTEAPRAGSAIHPSVDQSNRHRRKNEASKTLPRKANSNTGDTFLERQKEIDNAANIGINRKFSGCSLYSRLTKYAALGETKSSFVMPSIPHSVTALSMKHPELLLSIEDATQRLLMPHRDKIMAQQRLRAGDKARDDNGIPLNSNKHLDVVKKGKANNINEAALCSTSRPEPRGRRTASSRGADPHATNQASFVKCKDHKNIESGKSEERIRKKDVKIGRRKTSSTTADVIDMSLIVQAAMRRIAQRKEANREPNEDAGIQVKPSSDMELSAITVPEDGTPVCIPLKDRKDTSRVSLFIEYYEGEHLQHPSERPKVRVRVKPPSSRRGNPDRPLYARRIKLPEPQESEDSDSDKTLVTSGRALDQLENSDETADHALSNALFEKGLMLNTHSGRKTSKRGLEGAAQASATTTSTTSTTRIPHQAPKTKKVEMEEIQDEECGK